MNLFKFLGKNKEDSTGAARPKAQPSVPGVLNPGQSAPEILAEGRSRH